MVGCTEKSGRSRQDAGWMSLKMQKKGAPKAGQIWKQKGGARQLYAQGKRSRLRKADITRLATRSREESGEVGMKISLVSTEYVANVVLLFASVPLSSQSPSPYWAMPMVYHRRPPTWSKSVFIQGPPLHTSVS